MRTEALRVQQHRGLHVVGQPAANVTRNKVQEAVSTTHLSFSAIKLPICLSLTAKAACSLP
jgi:hypothetical protein